MRRHGHEEEENIYMHLVEVKNLRSWRVTSQLRMHSCMLSYVIYLTRSHHNHNHTQTHSQGETCLTVSFTCVVSSFHFACHIHCLTVSSCKTVACNNISFFVRASFTDSLPLPLLLCTFHIK